MLVDFLSRFKEGNILIIGDVILDSCIFVQAFRISLEASVPVLAEKRQIHILEGVANVANNVFDVTGVSDSAIVTFSLFHD